MGVLNKIKSATLVETIVATVLILILFVISSLMINNIFRNNFLSNTDDVERRLITLEYQLQNHQIDIPYNETYENWEIMLERQAESKDGVILMNAHKKGTKKAIEKTVYFEE